GAVRAGAASARSHRQARPGARAGHVRAAAGGRVPRRRRPGERRHLRSVRGVPQHHRPPRREVRSPVPWPRLGERPPTTPEQLTLGTLSLLIPSLAEMSSGREPIVLQLRPTQALGLTVLSGSPTTPYLNVHIENLEADLYALLYERYVRALTLSLTADVGLSLTFMLKN